MNTMASNRGRRLISWFGAAAIWFSLPAWAADGPVGVADRLTPPQRVPLPNLPRATRVDEAPSKKPVRASKPQWALPTVALPRESTLLPSERTKPRWIQPALDAPPLVSETMPTGPQTIVLQETARSFVASANPQRPAPANSSLRAIELPPKPTEDPTALATHSFLVRPQTTPAASPPPLLRLTIPDPDAALRAARIDGPPVTDGESYSVPRDLPPRPTLPVK